jgi:hypothetical protein
MTVWQVCPQNCVESKYHDVQKRRYTHEEQTTPGHGQPKIYSWIDCKQFSLG